MSTEINHQEEAKKIWDQLEAEDNGTAVAPAPSQSSERSDEGTANAAPEQQITDTQSTDEDDPKALREKLGSMEKLITQMATRLRSAEGHIGGLNSQVKQQLEAARSVAQAGAKAPSASEIGAAQSTPEGLAKLAEDYPEFAKALNPELTSLKSQLDEIRQKISQQPEPGEAKFVTRAELEEQRRQSEIETSIEGKHPGWKTTVEGVEFVDWLQKSPREYQFLAGSSDPQDAIRLLDIYKEQKAPNPQQKQQQRLSSAAALPTGQRSQVRTKSVDEMTAQEFWHYQDQLDKQKV